MFNYYFKVALYKLFFTFKNTLIKYLKMLKLINKNKFKNIIKLILKKKVNIINIIKAKKRYENILLSKI